MTNPTTTRRDWLLAAGAAALACGPGADTAWAQSDKPVRFILPNATG